MEETKPRSNRSRRTKSAVEFKDRVSVAPSRLPETQLERLLAAHRSGRFPSAPGDSLRLKAIARRARSQAKRVSIHNSGTTAKGESLIFMTSGNDAVTRPMVDGAVKTSSSVIVVADDKCPICGGDNVLLAPDSSFFQCSDCLSHVPTLDATATAFAFGDEPDYSAGPPTKTHHFEDWLKDMQPKECKRIDQAGLQKIVRHCCEVQGVKSGSDLALIHVRTASKALGIGSLHPSEMIWILCEISDVPPSTLTPAQETVFRTMFAAIQVPYARWKARLDPNRRNIFIYAHIVAKFCQILGWDRFLRVLHLPLQRRIIVILEAIFKGVCNDLGWEFVPLPDHMLYP